VRACLAGASIAPAKGQAGAHRFVDGQIGEVNAETALTNRRP
jgi:hypothetical protein